MSQCICRVFRTSATRSLWLNSRFCRVIWRARILALVSVMQSMWVSLAASQEVPSLELVMESWRKREQGIQTADLQYVNQHLIVRGSKLGVGGLPDATKLLPSRDLEVKVQLSLVIDKDKFRFAVSGPQWDNRAEDLVDTQHVLAFDGNAYTHYTGVPDATDRVHKLAFVYGSNEMSIQDMGFVLPPHVPLMQAFRPAHERFGGGRVGRWQVLSNLENIDEIPCIVFHSKEGALLQRMWFDPDNVNSLVRWYVEVNGKMLMQTDIEYAPNGSDRFVPQRWSTKRFQPISGELVESHEVSLDQFALNQPVDPKTFQLDFPFGTLVTEYPQPDAAESFISRGNGKRRTVTPAESMSGVKYTELVATESGKAAPLGRTSRRHQVLIVVLVNVVAFAAIALVIGIRLWRRKGTPRTPVDTDRSSAT